MMHTLQWMPINGGRIENILNFHDIKPLVGIVPANADPKLMKSPENEDFWDKARGWQSKGWTIALHGYNHVYHECSGGLNPLWDRSEFVGLSFDEQKKKLSSGKKILEREGLNVEYFFAPSHTFDISTIEALRQLGITKISDTIAFKPYKAYNMVFIPQIGGKCRKMLIPGIYTFCFHPNTMSEHQFAELETFLTKNHELFIGFNDLNLSNLKSSSIMDNIMRRIYFLTRCIKH